jgi:mannose-6-phosphate isomerase-like protein (cupin superfamily)
MKYVVFDEAEIETPGAEWRRAGLVNSEGISVDWFQKPPGHVSERHSHENEQVFVILDGKFILHTEDESVQLSQNDTAWVDAWEEHYSENPGRNSLYCDQYLESERQGTMTFGRQISYNQSY